MSKAVCTEKRKHSTAQQHRKNNVNETENFGKKRKSPSLSCNEFLPDWNTLHGSEKTPHNSGASLSASYAARPFRDHLATDSVRVKLPLLSATVSPVARLAISRVFTLAVVRQLDNVVAQTG